MSSEDRLANLEEEIENLKLYQRDRLKFRIATYILGFILIWTPFYQYGWGILFANFLFG